MKFLLIGDPHIMERRPICRVDEFMEAQEQKWEFIREKAEYADYVLCPGDLFEDWDASKELVNRSFDLLPDNLIVIPGNHDLPRHNIRKIHKSAMGILWKAGKIRVLIREPLEFSGKNRVTIHPFPWRTSPTSTDYEGVNIALIHYMTWIGKDPYPGIKEISAGRLLRRMKGFDLILSGHNHERFGVDDNKGHRLVNPGSLMRTEATQISHKPCVYFWDSLTKELTKKPIPIEKGVVTRVHLERREEKDERMNVVIRRMKEDFEVGLSFKKNMEEYIRTHRIRKGVLDKIYFSMGGTSERD